MLEFIEQSSSANITMTNWLVTLVLKKRNRSIPGNTFKRYSNMTLRAMSKDITFI